MNSDIEPMKLPMEEKERFAAMLCMYKVNMSKISKRTLQLLINLFAKSKEHAMAALEHANNNAKTNFDRFLAMTIENSYYDSLPIDTSTKDIPEKLGYIDLFMPLFTTETPDSWFIT